VRWHADRRRRRRSGVHGLRSVSGGEVKLKCGERKAGGGGLSGVADCGLRRMWSEKDSLEFKI
jgi:hypothetical protein